MSKELTGKMYVSIIPEMVNAAQLPNKVEHEGKIFEKDDYIIRFKDNSQKFMSKYHFQRWFRPIFDAEIVDTTIIDEPNIEQLTLFEDM